MPAENTGALASAYDMPDAGDETIGGRDIARSMAYGSGASPTDMTGALGALIDPERNEKNERLAFWGGATGPNNGTGSGAMSGAVKAQLETREAQDKLKAAFVPMIMQSIQQQRANDVAYSKLAMDRMKETVPLINSALYGMQADGATPDINEAHARIDAVGKQYNLSPAELRPHHQALAQGAGPDGSGLPQYLQQLRVASAPAAEGIAKFGTNAAGQTTRQNPISGSVQVAGAEGNPTKTAVKAHEESIGDIKGYSDQLRGTVDAYRDMSQRVNAIDKNLAEFTPGKYAGIAGGFAAAVRDLTERFPGASSDTIRKFADSILGSDGKADPIAAAQFAESLKTQEAISQLKTSLDGQGQVGQREMMMINRAMLGNISDKGAYAKFKEFMNGQAANAMNKYAGWSEHIQKTPYDKLSVHGFDVPWEVNVARQLQKGAYGQVDTPPGQTAAVPRPPAPVAAPAAVAPAPQAPKTPAQNVDLSLYEPGSKVGPTGMVYVIEKGVPRVARSRMQEGKVQ